MISIRMTTERAATRRILSVVLSAMLLATSWALPLTLSAAGRPAGTVVPVRAAARTMTEGQTREKGDAAALPAVVQQQTPGQNFDFSDAPASYNVAGVFPDAPPKHQIPSGAGGAVVPRLGTLVDAEGGAIPSILADGDDLDGSDDEDGVIFLTPVVAGGIARVRVTRTHAGYLHGWMDFNGDEMFEPYTAASPENIIPNQLVGAGASDFLFQVPLNAVPNPSTGFAYSPIFRAFLG
jgi:hypothetical protein